MCSVLIMFYELEIWLFKLLYFLDNGFYSIENINLRMFWKIVIRIVILISCFLDKLDKVVGIISDIFSLLIKNILILYREKK